MEPDEREELFRLFNRRLKNETRAAEKARKKEKEVRRKEKEDKAKESKDKESLNGTPTTPTLTATPPPEKTDSPASQTEDISASHISGLSSLNLVIFSVPGLESRSGKPEFLSRTSNTFTNLPLRLKRF
jgi:hypothetical protein